MDNEETYEPDQDNDYEKLFNKMEVIQFYSYRIKKSIFKKKKFLFIILLILLFILILSCSYYYMNYHKRINYKLVTYKNKGDKKQNVTEQKKNVGTGGKSEKAKQKEPKKIQKKPGIGFLYPKLTKYVVTTGEYLLKLQKYNIFYLLQKSNPSETELKYSQNITRINAYYNQKIIQQTIENENIKFLILNDAFSKQKINWLKSLGVKLIGIFDDIFLSSNEKSTRNNLNMWRYDAFIQNSLNDYNTYKEKNFTRNIFIPNIYDTTKTKLSSLNNHNIILLGKLKDSKNGVVNAITALSSIVKEFPDTKLNIISSDSQTLTINQLIKKNSLSKNINFLPFDNKISYYCIDSSIFLYTSLIEDCSDAIKEAMSHGLPCLISNDISKNLFFGDGIVNVDITNVKEIASKITKLLKDNKYKNKVGMGAKLSLDKINEDAVSIWDKIFISLLNGEKDFQKLRASVETMYTQKKENKVASITTKSPAKKKTVVATTPQKKSSSKKQTTVTKKSSTKKNLEPAKKTKQSKATRKKKIRRN